MTKPRQVAGSGVDNKRGTLPFYQTWDWHWGKRATSGRVAPWGQQRKETEKPDLNRSSFSFFFFSFFLSSFSFSFSFLSSSFSFSFSFFFFSCFFFSFSFSVFSSFFFSFFFFS